MRMERMILSSADQTWLIVCYVFIFNPTYPKEELKWDGRNDRGKVVLNGVYLCQIQIRGGSDLTFMTKIAYIK